MTLHSPLVRKAFGPLALLLLVLLLDALSKEMARHLLAGRGDIAVIPWLLDLRLVFNKGISFGLLADAGNWAGWTIIVLSILLSLFALRQIFHPASGRIAALGWALFAAGALGNLWERIWHGEVTDFLALKIVEWPLFVFNIADFSLTTSIGLIVLGDWLRISGKTT